MSTKQARGYFLLEFTRQLIRNNKNANIYLLDQILQNKFPEEKEQVIVTKEAIQEKLKQKSQPLKRKDNKIILRELKESSHQSLNTINLIKNQKKVLTVPRPNTGKRKIEPPTHFQSNAMGKLEPLIKDANVKSMSIEAPNQKVIVEGTMGKKNTNITLTLPEIQEILTEFSQKSKIPVTEGITQITLNPLALTVIRAGQDSHLIIRKSESESAPKPLYA